MLMRSALFWDITKRVVVIIFRRFGTIYCSHLQDLALEDGNNTVFRNLTNELPLYAAQYPRRVQNYLQLTCWHVSRRTQLHGVRI
jgi:hypothetical protein